MLRIKHSTKSFITLLISGILALSSLIATNASATVTPAANPDTLSVTYQFDESEILNWLDTRQSMKNLRTQSIAGEPLTPYKVANILLPPYTEVADVSVVGKVGGAHIVKDIPCGQPPAIIGEEPAIVDKNPNIYNSNELYPKEIRRVGSTESFRGYRILHVQLYPVQHTPASKLALYYREMTVQVKLKEGPMVDTLRNLAVDRETVENLVDNPSVLATYDSILSTLDSSNQTYEYLIITTNQLADEFQVLADWKANFVNGAKVQNVSAGTSAAEIKSIIKEYYANHSTSYVLLGGDVGVIPYHTKTLFVPAYAQIAEDCWFANLHGDDEISYYDVYIGRAPVDSKQEAAQFVNKVIAYEQMSKPKANLFHQSRATYENYPDTCELAWQCEQYVPPDYINYELFEENGKIEKTDWINFWGNDGIMCEHIGHGNETGYIVNGVIGGEVRWDNADVASMDNTFWPVQTSVACFSGAFEYEDCLAEAYVKDPNNGAIACLMNDNYGLYEPHDATQPSGDFIEMQFKGLYQEGIENIGAMLAYSKHCFVDEATDPSNPIRYKWEWCWREINLIGDPETPLLTTRTQTKNVVKNSGWESGNNSCWNASTTKEPNSLVDYGVNQGSACNGSYGFHVSMRTSSTAAKYTTQSLTESQSLSESMLDAYTKLEYWIYPAYELHGVDEIPQARWEIVLFFSTGNKLHYYGSLNAEPTENSTDRYVYIPLTLSQWNKFFDNSVLETYTCKFGTRAVGTTIMKITAYVTSKTYAARTNKFNQVVAKFDSDEATEGFQCTLWWVKNFNTGLVYDAIQKAIDDNETLDGDTISVKGIYYENIVVDKSLKLVGHDPSTAIIDGGGAGNVITVQADNCIIRHFTIQNGGTYTHDGIYEECSKNTLISGNTLSNNCFGICLFNSTSNTVVGNIVSNNKMGIYVSNPLIGPRGAVGSDSGNHSICSNIVSNNGYESADAGIYIYYSRNNTLRGNTISNNTRVGIELFHSYGTTTIENVISKNVVGLRLYLCETSFENCTSYHNNFINNTEAQASRYGSSYLSSRWDDGYPFGGNYWSDYKERYPNAMEVDASGIWDTPYVVDVSNQDNYPLVNPWTPAPRTWSVDDDGPAAFHTIQEAVNAANPGDTIHVYNGTYHEHVIVNKYNLTLTGEGRSTTIIDGNGTGVVVTIQEKRIRISQFTIQNGECGIYVKRYIAYTSVSGNTVTNNTYGIYLYYSHCNTVSDNRVSNNERYGIYVSNWGSSVLEELEFRPPGPPPPQPSFGNNSITGNTVLNNGYEPMDAGIYLFCSENNSICGNTVSDNPYYGICLNYSAYAKITGNEISCNTNGLLLSRSYDNTIYHNNFINNTNQAFEDWTNVWDNGYPSGGNYWSNYADVDQYNGPYQNKTGSDGIWDHSCNVGGYNIDRYPLVNPWPVHDVAVVNVVATPTEVLCGDSASVMVTVMNQGDFSETFGVTAYCNYNVIGMQVVLDLALRESKTLIFSWNTTGVNPGDYVIKAVASVVGNETDMVDNTKINGTVTVKAWDLLSEPWNKLGDWTMEGKGTSTIATLEGKSSLYNKPNSGNYVTQKKDIGTLLKTGYTVETSLYAKSWGSGGTDAFVAFKFYDGTHLVTIEIHCDRLVGPADSIPLQTQAERWYKWRFVIDSDAEIMYVYRDGQYVGTLAEPVSSTINDGLVYCSWTQNPASCSGCESYTDYIEIATGLYGPS